MGNGASVKSEEPKSSNKNIDDSKASFVQAPILDEPMDSGADSKGDSKQLKKLALGQVGYKDTHRDYDAALKSLTTDKNSDSKPAKPQFSAQDVSKIKNSGGGPQMSRPPPPRQPPPAVTITANHRKSNPKQPPQPKPSTASNAVGKGNNIGIAPSSIPALVPPMQGPPPGYGPPQQQGTPVGNPLTTATATQFTQPQAKIRPNIPPVRRQPSVKSKLSITQKKYTEAADYSDDSDSDEGGSGSEHGEGVYDWIDGTEQPPAGAFAIAKKSNRSDSGRRSSDPAKVATPNVSNLKVDIHKPVPSVTQPDKGFLLANFAPDIEDLDPSPIHARPSKVPALNIPVSSSAVNGPMYKTVDIGSTSANPTPTHGKVPTPTHGHGTAKPPPPKMAPPMSPMRNITSSGPPGNVASSIYASNSSNSPMPGQRVPPDTTLTGPKPSANSPSQPPRSSNNSRGSHNNNPLASSVESTVSNVGNVMRGSVHNNQGPGSGPYTTNGSLDSSMSINAMGMGTNMSVSSSSTMGPGTATGPYTTGRTMGVRATPPPKPTKSLMPHAVKETTDVKRNKIQLPTNMLHAKPTAGDWLKKRYIVNNYILLDTLGTGSYGEVRLCKDRVTENLYAIKIISRDLLKKKKHGHNSETFFEDIRREIAIMKKLLHPNVLRLYEVLDDNNVNKMYLVVEYMKNGDLINLLERDRGDTNDSDGKKKSKTMNPLPEGEVWNIFRQVAAGIRYLHYQNVVHGDIKPQNLLVSDTGIIKIADFGISKMLNDNAEKMTDGAGTPAFMSPELIAGQAFSGQLADVWALGATMFMLVYGSPPWVASNILNLYNKIQTEELTFPETPAIDPGLRDLLTNMMTKDPNDRITIQQVLQHPWFRQPPPPHKFKIANIVKKTNGTPSEGTGSGHGSAVTSARGISFMPPKSYDKEEAAAMEAPPVKTNESDMFMSIGTRYDDEKKSAEAKESKGCKESKLVEEDGEDYDDMFATCVDDEEEGDDDDDDDEPKRPMEKIKEAGESKVALMDEEEDGVNVMNTNWGDDVFEMVDDGEQDSEDDDDDDEMPPTKANAEEKDSAMGTTGTNSSSTGSLTHHTEMTTEELERRQMKFKKKNKQKSTASLVALGTGPKPIDLSSHNIAALGDKQVDKKNSMPPSIAIAMQKRNSPPSGFLSTDSTPKKRVSSKKDMGNSPKRDDDEEEDSEDDVEAMNDDEFSFMMDTLARQPKDEEEKELPVIHVNFNKVRVKASQTNSHNDVKIACHSEQGMRTSQEDRCVVVPNVAKLPIFNNSGLRRIDIENDAKQFLHQFSIVCVFDGHSGHHVSQYLFDNFVNDLVENYSRFLGKNLQSLMVECCENIDNAICRALRADEDTAGSTGVMAVYDGRKHVLTVANVGDSSCILCKKDGKAFRVLKMHRCADEGERARITKCNAKVMNNRVNGVLAVSRAFGDIQFKDFDPSTSELLLSANAVIGTPDIYSEVIPPDVEFAVLGTDGLFDILDVQSVANYVRKCLHEQADLQHTAVELAKEAISKGSVDNVTAAIIVFHSSMNS